MDGGQAAAGRQVERIKKRAKCWYLDPATNRGTCKRKLPDTPWGITSQEQIQAHYGHDKTKKTIEMLVPWYLDPQPPRGINAE